jgi:hypothetical protein
VERIVPWQDCERILREAHGSVELMLMDEGNRVADIESTAIAHDLLTEWRGSVTHPGVINRRAR